MADICLVVATISAPNASLQALARGGREHDYGALVERGIVEDGERRLLDIWLADIERIVR